MTRDELRNTINNACDIMRHERLTTIDYASNSFALAPPAVARQGELW